MTFILGLLVDILLLAFIVLACVGFQTTMKRIVHKPQRNASDSDNGTAMGVLQALNGVATVVRYHRVEDEHGAPAGIRWASGEKSTFCCEGFRELCSGPFARAESEGKPAIVRYFWENATGRQVSREVHHCPFCGASVSTQELPERLIQRTKFVATQTLVYKETGAEASNL